MGAPHAVPPVRRPPMLAPGDTVMLVSPSGPTTPERLARGVELLGEWGLRVVVAKHAYDRAGFLAGDDVDRLADLNQALEDPSIAAVICTRGGYGAQRIVDGLNLDAVRASPKLVVGFSDITALQLALWRGARLASVHGLDAARLDGRAGPGALDALRRAVMSTEPIVVSRRDDEPTAAVRVRGDAGAVTGVLLGGNLSLLAASVGTVDFPGLRGAILLIEEVGEPPYKVDRMLLHLRRAGALSGLIGVALGQFTDCADGWPTTVADVLADQLGAMDLPVLGGLPIGHGRDPVSVAIGVPAVINVTAGTLSVESAVRGPHP